MNTIFIDHNDKKSFYVEKLQDYMTPNGVDIQFSYESDFKNAKILRDSIEYILKAFDVSSKDVSRFVLAADEMNNNAIEHGSNQGDCNKLHLRLLKTQSAIEIVMEVEDSGNGPKSKTAAEMDMYKKEKSKLDFTKHNSIRWRWLFLIIINIVDELYFQDSQSGWLIVGIKKDLPYSG